MFGSGRSTTSRSFATDVFHALCLPISLQELVGSTEVCSTPHPFLVDPPTTSQSDPSLSHKTPPLTYPSSQTYLYPGHLSHTPPGSTFVYTTHSFFHAPLLPHRPLPIFEILYYPLSLNLPPFRYFSFPPSCAFPLYINPPLFS